MNDKLILKEEHFIARGGERDCYNHPLDSSKVIKVLYKKDGVYAYDGNRNNLEYKYYTFLEKSKISFSHIARCYNFVETNLGDGLVFDKVFDYDGKISSSFRQLLIEKKFTIQEENLLIEKLKDYIFENSILFIDCGVQNILCCEYEKNKYKLVIIDGLGAKREGLRSWLYLNSKTYTKYKIKRQWIRFIEKYKIFKKKIAQQVV